VLEHGGDILEDEPAAAAADAEDRKATPVPAH
jgi:hypothetical protein